uniref:Uncharacterized protein n=1 Tax=Globodera rostochiensis TaxID=31243 RepID=A0A914IAB9_GLORO
MENIPPSTNELEKMEKELLEGKGPQRNSRSEELKKDIAKMLAQLQNDMRADIQASVDGLWAKTEPLLAGQERATAALAEALDECTENGAWARKSEPNVETKSPSPMDNPPVEGGEPDPADQVLVPPVQAGGQGKNRQTSPGLRDRGQSGAGPKGTWKKSGPKHQMRVGYLVRQLEREWKGPHAPQNCQWSCQCWNCRRGRWGDRGGRGGGFGRGNGGGGSGYGRGRMDLYQRADPSHYGH